MRIKNIHVFNLFSEASNNSAPFARLLQWPIFSAATGFGPFIQAFLHGMNWQPPL